MEKAHHLKATMITKLITKKIRLIILLASFLVGFSCSTKRVTLTILGGRANYAEMRNGNRIVFNDSISSDPITGVSKIINVKYNFKDSMHAVMRFPGGDSVFINTRIPKNNFIYIELYYIEMKAYSTKKKKGFI